MTISNDRNEVDKIVELREPTTRKRVASLDKFKSKLCYIGKHTLIFHYRKLISSLTDLSII